MGKFDEGKLPTIHQQPTAPATWPLGPDCQLTVLSPQATSAGDDAPAVLALTYGNRRILFAQALDEPTTRNLVHSLLDLKADLLIAPAHGSADRYSQTLLEQVNPRWVIASNPRKLSGKQQAFNQLCTGRVLLRSGQHGAITVTISPTGEIDVQTRFRE